MSKLKYWVHVRREDNALRIHHGVKPGHVLVGGGPFDTEQEAAAFKKEVTQEARQGKAFKIMKDEDRRRGKGSPRRGRMQSH